MPDSQYYRAYESATVTALNEDGTIDFSLINFI